MKFLFTRKKRSYEKKLQREIQRAYFSHTKFSIFTVCCYLQVAENKLIWEPIMISSELQATLEYLLFQVC